LKVKLKGRHFDTFEVIEVESQAVLNTLTEHGFQDAFKNDKRAFCLSVQSSRLSVQEIVNSLVNEYFGVIYSDRICKVGKIT
jgi:hypothetical protein